MANPKRGEAVFKASTGISYKIVMDLNAYALAEEAADMGLNALLKSVSPRIDTATGQIIEMPRLKPLGALLWGGLQEHHPEMTRADANRLLGEVAAGEALAKAMQASLPESDASAGGKAPVVRGIGSSLKKTGRRKA